MPKLVLSCVLIAVALSVETGGQGSGTNGNLRLCVVEARGGYKKAPRHCPVLDNENSGVECVVASDRLDCLQRMSKGTVDFGVFNPEDLLISQLDDLDLLVTNELRQKSSQKFEAEIACLVSQDWLSKVGTEGGVGVILRNSTLCHPGQGSIELTDTLGDYLESLLTEPSCEPELSLAENRILSLSRFFRAACKPGPWVFDEKRDAVLKSLYPSLCSACSYGSCSPQDPYFGRQGSLNCLSDRAGDFTWVSVEDVKQRFGLNGRTPRGGIDDPSRFAYLCKDGTTQSLTGNQQPCVWLNKPWKVIVSKRKSAEAVSHLETLLMNGNVTVDRTWRGALIALLESRTALPQPLQPQETITDYLNKAKGFQSAYSKRSCNPPRHISICTVGVLEFRKCEWLAQAGLVYGVEPQLQCTQQPTRAQCINGTSSNREYADVAIASADWLVPAQRDYSVVPILFESNPVMREMNIIKAYVRNDSQISKMADLRGKNAAFPIHDGVAWHSVLQYLDSSGLMKIGKPFEAAISAFFGQSCAPGLERLAGLTQAMRDNLSKICVRDNGTIVEGEEAALKLLIEGSVDVAFLSMRAVTKYTGVNASQPWASKVSENSLRAICPDENVKYCYISWSSPGQVYISKNLPPLRRQEILNALQLLDKLFGKRYPFHIPAFTMFGPFSKTSDVLFHDNMNSLVPVDKLQGTPYKSWPRNFELSLTPGILNKTYIENGARTYESSIVVISLSLVSCVIVCTLVRY